MGAEQPNKARNATQMICCTHLSKRQSPRAQACNELPRSVWIAREGESRPLSCPAYAAVNTSLRSSMPKGLRRLARSKVPPSVRHRLEQPLIQLPRRSRRGLSLTMSGAMHTARESHPACAPRAARRQHQSAVQHSDLSLCQARCRAWRSAGRTRRFAAADDAAQAASHQAVTLDTCGRRMAWVIAGQTLSCVLEHRNAVRWIGTGLHLNACRQDARTWSVCKVGSCAKDRKGQAQLRCRPPLICGLVAAAL